MNYEKIKRYLPILTLIVLILIVGVGHPDFLRPMNLINLASEVTPLFIMALGITFVIYIGGIDLSCQQIANMTTVIATVALVQFGFFAGVICLVAGILLGMFSGYVTSRLYVPSFISTLATGGIAYSLAQYISGQKALYMDATLRQEYFGWMIGSLWGIPSPFIISVVLLLVMGFIQYRTTLGRKFKAVGAGEEGAKASGLNVDRIKIAAFAFSAGLAAFAGLLFAVKLSGGSPTMANGFLLPAIVAVLVGGTPLTGGVGGVFNTAIGTLIVATIRSALVYQDVDATQQQMIFGLVLIVAIALTIDRSKLAVVK